MNIRLMQNRCENPGRDGFVVGFRPGVSEWSGEGLKKAPDIPGLS